MRRAHIFFTYFFFATLLIAQSETPTFGSRETLGEIQNDEITEASGIVASIQQKGVFWTHNDSGNKNKIFAIDTAGNSLGEFTLDNIENRDWEDIAIEYNKEDSTTYLYLADIGDNEAQYTIKYIYKIPEPIIDFTDLPNKVTISDIKTITFYYPDQNRDAETLLFDPITKDIFVVSKRDSIAVLYCLPYPQSYSSGFEAEFASEFQLPQNDLDDEFNYITAGDISVDGTEILLKTYSEIFYWQRNTSKSIAETLAETPIKLPFQNSIDELQGEAICWNPFDDKGYFTLSEQLSSFPVYLYYYRRNNPTAVNENVSDYYKLELEQNYPNPFNPTTTIKYTLPITSNSEKVKLSIVDLLGNQIKVLVDERQSAGTYEINFNSDQLTSGIYFYKLSYGNLSSIKKMILLK